MNFIVTHLGASKQISKRTKLKFKKEHNECARKTTGYSGVVLGGGTLGEVEGEGAFGVNFKL